jgi:exportin-2 (importin alpha re-exporter)
LVQLFQDLSSQDLPPYFEEHLTVFMGTADGSEQGWLRKYLSWERTELKGDVSTLMLRGLLQG